MSLDGSSADSDGTIISHAWDFGDGTTARTSGTTPDHTYAHTAGYTVTLTVTDDAGATATQSETVTPISLTARGYKLKGLERVDLSWTGPVGASFDVSRNGTRIATVQTTAYTDQINQKGSGTYTYKVCAAEFASCSDPVTVSFSPVASIRRATRPARDSALSAAVDTTSQSAPHTGRRNDDEKDHPLARTVPAPRYVPRHAHDGRRVSWAGRRPS